MKKSKFLLLGSVASLASIPFVAAKCGETKDEEEKKPEVDKKPGEGKEPGQNTDQGKNPETNASPKEETKTDISKLDEKTKKELSKQLKGEFSENPSYDNIVKELQKHFKGLNKKHILVQGSKDKLKITATGVGSNPFRGTLLLSNNNGESSAKSTKTDISKLDEKTKKELSKQLKGEFSENPSYDNIVKELQKHFKGLNKKHILVQGSKDKLKITATGVGSNPFRGTLLLSKM